MYSAVFIGAGDASSRIGHASCLIEQHQRPWLLIDCGHGTLNRYFDVTGNVLPSAVFITHLHWDHIGDLEQLYFKAFHHNQRPILYVPVSLVEPLFQLLQHTAIAESGENVWDRLSLVPVKEGFWHKGVKLRVHPVRHHRPNSAFALHLPGHFFFSGDTRPIPEILHHEVCQSELIFHDCGLTGNPSHSGIEEILKEYQPDVLARIWAYHYHDDAMRQRIYEKGLNVVLAGQRIDLSFDQHKVLEMPPRQA